MKLFSLSALVAVLLLVASVSPAAYSNFPGGLAVGKSSASTYVYLTGVSEVTQEIPLRSILTGTNGTTALADTAVTTALYVSQATGLTNQAAVTFPAVLDTGVASVGFQVPWNYSSGGHLVISAHTNVSFAAGGLSVTAHAYGFNLNGTTTTAIAAGTAVQIPTSAATSCITFTATNSAVYLTPGGRVTFKLSKTSTSGLVSLELMGLSFNYVPSSVINGR